MIRTFIQITSLLFTLLAAVFLSRGGLALSPGAIAELAATKVDFNLDLVASFSGQRADTFVGIVLLLIGFTLQLTNSLWPIRYMDFVVHRGAAVFAVMFAFVVGFGAFYASNELAAYTEATAKKTFDTTRGAQKQQGHAVSGAPDQGLSDARSPKGVSAVTPASPQNPPLEPPKALRRILWWATFTAVTATVLALALRNPEQPNVWAVRFLAASLILSILKFFHWSHDDLKYPVIGWVIEVLNRTTLGPVIGALAVAAFVLGFVGLYRRW